jgi:hypothetical protein
MRRSEDKDPYIEDRIDNFRKQCGDNYVHFPGMVETQRYVKIIMDECINWLYAPF